MWFARLQNVNRKAFGAGFLYWVDFTWKNGNNGNFEKTFTFFCKRDQAWVRQNALNPLVKNQLNHRWTQLIIAAHNCHNCWLKRRYQLWISLVAEVCITHIRVALEVKITLWRNFHTPYQFVVRACLITDQVFQPILKFGFGAKNYLKLLPCPSLGIKLFWHSNSNLSSVWKTNLQWTIIFRLNISIIIHNSHHQKSVKRIA